MMPFMPPDEPPDFDQQVRRPGQAWLEQNSESEKPFPALWLPFRVHLAEGFHNLCAYSVMLDLTGTVDHYFSRKNYRHLTYEWSNYRYVSGWINSSKQDEDDKVLDPFLVRDSWFEILLPSLQLVLTDSVPPEERERADYTLRRLRLRDDERIIRQRRAWYGLYQEGKLTLEGLKQLAPLIAKAVQKQLPEG